MINKKYFNLINISKFQSGSPAVFMDTVESVNNALLELGYQTKLSNNVILSDAINIIWGAGAHFSPELEEIEKIASPSNTIIFNMEQIDSGSPLVTEKYLNFLSKYVVLDYNSNNLDKIKALRNITGFEFPLLPSRKFTSDYNSTALIEKKYDLGFYGFINSKRENILKEFDKYNIKIKKFTGLYGDKLASEILDCRAILNIHAYDSSIFEIARCLRPLAMGIPIISERSILPTSLNWNDSGIIFADAEVIAEKTFNVINDQNSLLISLQKSLIFINSEENKIKIKNTILAIENLF